MTDLVTIISAYWPDSEMRRANFNAFFEHWAYVPGATVIVGDMENRSRSEAINAAAQFVETPHIGVVDLDVEIPMVNFNKTIQALQDGFDMVYPYDRILDKDGVRLTEWPSRYKYGCACFFNADKYRAAGGENEQFRGWGYDDFERHYRMLNHGLMQVRIFGHIFHRSHPRAQFTPADIRHNVRLYKAEKDKYDRRQQSGSDQKAKVQHHVST